MSKGEKAASTYLKFLNLVQAVRSSTSFPVMDPVEEKLLNFFATAWHAGKPLTVVEAMNNLPDLSSSTVHRRLVTLREKGMVELEIDPLDNRVKYIVGTDAANQYFAQLGKCLDLAKGI
jgi:hypothetical protein